MKKTYSEEQRMCAYCENATLISDSSYCICANKGLVEAEGVCKKFIFDLLKLNPKPVKTPKFEEIF